MVAAPGRRLARDPRYGDRCSVSRGPGEKIRCIVATISTHRRQPRHVSADERVRHHAADRGPFVVALTGTLKSLEDKLLLLAILRVIWPLLVLIAIAVK